MWSVSSALGKLFFVSGFLPALAFLAACDLVIIPALFDGRHLVDVEALGINGIAYVVGGTVLGFVLLALNRSIVRRFEKGLLLSSWLKRRNQQRHRERYTALHAYRESYQEASAGEKDASQALAELEAVHRAIEKQFGRTQELPYDEARVMPTDLGNVFAVTEDYAYERYGMDTMVYWPRLVTFIPSEYQSQITDQKATLDFMLNLSLLSLLFGLGALGVGAWFQTLPEILYGILAWALAYGFYRGAVQSAAELGILIRGSFDLYRGGLLEQLGLSRPEELVEEKALWLRLASFIQRGESFYFPERQKSDSDED